jgi:hypothetical protein
MEEAIFKYWTSAVSLAISPVGQTTHGSPRLSSLRLLASHDSDAGAKPMTQSIIEALQRENAELRGRVDRFRKLLTTSSSRG